MTNQFSLASVVVCSEPWQIDLQALRFILRARSNPQFDYELEEDFGTGESLSGVVTGATVVNFEGRSIIIASLEKPVPSEQLVYGPPNPNWPNAPSDLANHRAHVRVIVRDEPKSRLELVRAIRDLLQLTAAICEASNAVGVMWCPSNNLLPAAHFLSSYYQNCKLGTDPIDVLVRVAYSSRPDGLLLATHGLLPLVGREMEVGPARPEVMNGEQLYQRAMQIASYLFVGGSEEPNKFDRGDTIGPEGFRVELLDAGVLAKGPVYRILM